MSGKRQATSDVNHINWDQEEEPEEQGHFKEAAEEELKTRVIKKARRRITDSTTADSSGAKSIFGGFTGFTKTTNTSESTKIPSLFSFLNKTPADTSLGSNTATSTQSTTITTTATPANTKTTGFSFGTLSNVDIKPKSEKADAAKDEAYFAKVIKLNQSFCEWIKEHVDKQPLCNLMSTFKDYEKHWEQIKQEKPLTNVNTAASVSSTTTSTSSSVFGNIKFNAMPLTAQSTGFGTSKTNQTTEKSENNLKTNGLEHANKKANGSLTGTSSQFSFEEAKSNDKTTAKEANNVITPFTFGSPSSKSKTETSPSLTFGVKAVDKPTTSSAASNISGFSFGLAKKDESPPSATSFSFGVKNDEIPASTGFSFTSGSVPFSFGNIKPPAPTVDTKDAGDDDENEDEPPKVEIKEIVEDDAVFTKKCKIFVKKDNAYKDFGVGTLYLKPVNDSSKIQLLVRSSNNLGTILINLLLVEGSVVTQRVGKNNVMIVHPNKDGETQTTLVRVKDGVEADALLEEINKHKK